MPGPGGQGINSLLDLVQQPQSGVNPIAGGGNFGTFGLNQWSTGAGGAPPNQAVLDLIAATRAQHAANNGPGTGGGPFQGSAEFEGAAMPGNSGYFDVVGGAIQPHIGSARQAAADAGVSLDDLRRGFLPRSGVNDSQAYSYPSDRGGWFTGEDLFTQPNGPPQEVPGMLGANGQPTMSQPRGNMPQMAAFGMSQPSTNNWRLLGMGPGWIMRNGFLINTLDPSVRRGYAAGQPANMGNSGEQSIPGGVSVSLGSGVSAGFPNMYQAGLGQPAGAGWPGATYWVPIFPGNS